MKILFPSFFNPHSKLLLMLCALPICVSAQSKTNPASTTAASTNDFVAPLATFIKPKTRAEGRDPFYPRSSYPYIGDAPIIVETNKPLPTVAVELKLKGISGLPPHRLAVINNHTFEAGEEAEVATTNGRMSIRCLEISDNSATIQVGPEQRVLRMRNF